LRKRGQVHFPKMATRRCGVLLHFPVERRMHAGNPLDRTSGRRQSTLINYLGPHASLGRAITSCSLRSHRRR
jgi:hypothetical protein